jgi:hypothetical protein
MKLMRNVLQNLMYFFDTIIRNNTDRGLQHVLTTLCKPKTGLLFLLLLLLSIGLPVANAPDVLQPCGLLYYP